MRYSLIAASAAVTLLSCLPAARAQTAPTAAPARALDAETPEQRDARMAWWRDAKFGMFIHWGVYSVPAGQYEGKPVGGIGEWIMNRAKIPVATYKGYAKDFTAAKYDPEFWAKVAKDAGMRYVVLTSKHHDGFALYDSKVTDWDMVDATPFKKDAIAPLAAAVRKEGMRFGLYYSQAQDWNHPGGAKAGYPEGGGWDDAQKGSFDEYIAKIAVPQTREILANYNLDILWWDTPTHMTQERADRFRAVTRAYPNLITNNRLGFYKGDTDTPEQHIPATGIPGRDWEVCMTMNGTWGYRSDDNNWKSTTALLHMLSDIVSKGGNFLLNVGPDSQGRIPQPSVDRLREVGRWMKTNGEAIYGTTASPFSKLSWGRVTKKVRPDGATLYLHVFEWPADGRLLAPGLRGKVKSARLLAGGNLATETTDEGVVVKLPARAPDPITSIVKLEIEGPLTVEKVMAKPNAEGVLALPASMADIHNTLGTNAFTEEKAPGRTNIGGWTDARAWVSWKAYLDKPGTYEITGDVAGTGRPRFTVSIGSKSVEAAATPTGDFARFQTIPLGRITVDAPGEYEIAVRPIKEGWGPFNLQGLTLRLAK